MILLFLNTFHSPKRHPNLPPPHQHDKSAHLLLILFPTNTTPSPNHYPPLTSLHPHSKYSPTPLNLHIPQSIPPLKQIKPSVISTLREPSCTQGDESDTLNSFSHQHNHIIMISTRQISSPYS
ncbi:hypothetical protein Pcinc_031993 [Petrolisthes cinctipes]|uniref:Uncharacterized protein n=1 Tax=Petrolisthes cinctipes TaxID=88211 RepID=A0AAE1EVR0_PETCI|nr:hypothetical protein Pcinc_032003 [Petrolisthes cinctipes]KAK3862113.1 hypothetical protein Pcinc_031993 [Petrolisthes cinctipes]